MTDDRYIITQDDINAMSDAVLCNYDPCDEGIAMAGEIPKEIDGGPETIKVYFEIRANEEPDNEAIYTVERILSAAIV